jgi:hypothetical protein
MNENTRPENASLSGDVPPNPILPDLFPATQNWSQRFASDFSRQNPDLINPVRSAPAAIPGTDTYSEATPSAANYDYSIDPSYL